MVRERIPVDSNMNTDEMVRDYQEYIRYGGAYYYRREVKQILRFGIETGRALDIATGTGWLAIELAKKAPNLEIFALDIAPKMIKQAKINTKEAGVNIQFVIGSAYNLPFSENCFDLVINSGTIHIIEDLLLFFDEIGRVLKPDSKAFVAAFRRDVASPLYQLAKIHTWFLRNKAVGGARVVIDCSYTKDEILKALSQTELKDYKITQNLFELNITISK